MVGLWNIRLLAQVNSHWVQFTLVRKGYDNHHCHNKPQTGNEAGVWMTSCPEEMVLRIWGFWKRVSWRLTLDYASRQLSFCLFGHRVEFSTVAAVVKIFRSLPTEILTITRCAVRGDGVSIVRIVSLLLVSKNWSQKLINRSYLNNRVHLYMYTCCIQQMMWSKLQKGWHSSKQQNNNNTSYENFKQY